LNGISLSAGRSGGTTIPVDSAFAQLPRRRGLHHKPLELGFEPLKKTASDKPEFTL